MKKITLSAAAFLTIGTFAVAGGNIVPIAAPIAPIIAPTPFYVGVGYSCLHMLYATPSTDIRSMSAVSIDAGYEINSFFAVEARYTASLGDITVKASNVETDYSWDMSNIGIYLKPKYGVGIFTVYGLLGYGQLSLDNGTEYSADGIQYGIGAGVSAAPNVDVYMDYRRLYDDTDFEGLAPDVDVGADSFTVGVNYRF